MRGAWGSRCCCARFGSALLDSQVLPDVLPCLLEALDVEAVNASVAPSLAAPELAAACALFNTIDRQGLGVAVPLRCAFQRARVTAAHRFQTGALTLKDLHAWVKTASDVMEGSVLCDALLDLVTDVIPTVLCHFQMSERLQVITQRPGRWSAEEFIVLVTRIALLATPEALGDTAFGILAHETMPDGDRVSDNAPTHTQTIPRYTHAHGSRARTGHRWFLAARDSRVSRPYWTRFDFESGECGDPVL